MVDDFLLVEDGNRSADVEDFSAVNKKQKVKAWKYFDWKIHRSVLAGNERDEK